MLREKYVQVVDSVLELINVRAYGEMSLSTKQVLLDLALKCQELADEESAKLAVKQPKLIQSNPYVLSQFSNIWAEGFEAGQKSTLTPVSVTGRWWQTTNNGNVFFADPKEYGDIQRAVDSNPDLCCWLTEEETREFV